LWFHSLLYTSFKSVTHPKTTWRSCMPSCLRLPLLIGITEHRYHEIYLFFFFLFHYAAGFLSEKKIWLSLRCRRTIVVYRFYCFFYFSLFIPATPFEYAIMYYSFSYTHIDIIDNTCKPILHAATANDTTTVQTIWLTCKYIDKKISDA